MNKEKRMAILREVCEQTDKHFLEYIGSVRTGVVETVLDKAWFLKIELDIYQCPNCEKCYVAGVFKKKANCLNNETRFMEE